MRVRFKCPFNGIPIIGDWEDFEMFFDLEDEEAANKDYTEEQIAEAEEWCCKRRGLIFDTERRANYFLEINGIQECWERW
ncbi:hypothetical protein [Paenibacillus sp. MMS20-IR301]|uniref:hypothetical protein n=1 Tax=Paenibacillus sp. MMS20-IR301 TaxID=2895946 RepID=UPI0028E78B59|nr:hypothetical protein [Paenibacillus sp. MMS20-IR301]WNS41780.1 hypothetical protein LOS79_22560 [Paenibacillus sp. MMS20-IR301]